jgi:hypothetical protein
MVALSFQGPDVYSPAPGSCCTGRIMGSLYPKPMPAKPGSVKRHDRAGGDVGQQVFGVVENRCGTEKFDEPLLHIRGGVEPSIPIRRWMRHASTGRPTSVNARCQA